MHSMIIGSTLIRKKILTNSLQYARLIEHSAADGTVIRTDSLEHAQGRANRVWSVKEGQLLVTIILKPSGGKDVLYFLTMALCIGVHEALKKYSKDVALKWPNDIVYPVPQSGVKKIAGILCEPLWILEKLSSVIVGIGINVNCTFMPGDELASVATSMQQEEGKTFCLDKVFSDLLFELDKAYKLFLAGDYEKIYQRWREGQYMAGRLVAVYQDSGLMVQGYARDFLYNGDLIVEQEKNKRIIVPFYSSLKVSLIQ